MCNERRERREPRDHGLVEPQVLAWRLSNTMEVDLCVDALEEALGCYGNPEIFN